MTKVLNATRLVGEAGAAICWLLVIESCLRGGTLPATCRRLGVRLDLSTAAAPAEKVVTLPHFARIPMRAALAVTAFWPAGDTCLRRCLLIGHRLRVLGPVLRIGVRRDAAGVFSAHSWLEFDGRTLDPGATGFAALGRIQP